MKLLQTTRYHFKISDLSSTLNRDLPNQRAQLLAGHLAQGEAQMANIEAILTNMAGNASPEKLAGVNLSIQFDLSGDEAGDFFIAINDGKVDTGKGTVDSPTATIKMDSGDYKDLMSGKLDICRAFLLFL